MPVHVLGDLEAETAGHFDQLHAARGVVLGEPLQCTLDAAGRCGALLAEQRLHLLHRQGGRGGQKGRLDDTLNV